MGNRKTIGDVIRKHLKVFQEREGSDPVGTDEGKKFLELPNEDRFNGAGMIYAAALQMLNEAVETVEGLMLNVVIHGTYPIDSPSDPERDRAIIRGWEVLRQFDLLPEIVKIEIEEESED